MTVKPDSLLKCLLIIVFIVNRVIYLVAFLPEKRADLRLPLVSRRTGSRQDGGMYRSVAMADESYGYDLKDISSVLNDVAGLVISKTDVRDKKASTLVCKSAAEGGRLQVRQSLPRSCPI
ncbi:hypothetical protein [Andreprevotia chitinilytica]|uniref:hypothetical protein n=1 Tax=Andreprevotia chitinilytica TaxID=396808 RepID=UPI00147025A8|nr:hypothetical protein [Andreprevotia chitinilytica]